MKKLIKILTIIIDKVSAPNIIIITIIIISAWFWEVSLVILMNIKKINFCYAYALSYSKYAAIFINNRKIKFYSEGYCCGCFSYEFSGAPKILLLREGDGILVSIPNV